MGGDQFQIEQFTVSHKVEPKGTPPKKSKGTTIHSAGWKGASTQISVLAELGHSQIQNRPLTKNPTKFPWPGKRHMELSSPPEKGSNSSSPLTRASGYGAGASFVSIKPNEVLSLVPMPLTAAMITSEMPAAIRPYSMAVAPDSSAKNLLRILFN
jgi:hypothetical protein